MNATLQPHRGSGSGGGFTLLEIMLAVTVFAIAVVGLLSALGTTVDAATAFNREAQVAFALQNQLAEAREEPWTGPGSETTGPDELGVTYTREIEPLELPNGDGPPLDRMYRLRITAQWGSADQEQTEMAEVYIHH